MRAADWAWIGLVSGVAVYEAFAPRGELLSEGMDRYLSGRWRWPVRVGVVLVAAHLLNVLPERADPLSWLAVACNR